MVENEKQQTSGVVRTIAILEALAHLPRTNLEQLSRQTGLPKATLLRFLNTLIGLGYVNRDPADQYNLTLKMFSVGSHSLEHLDLMDSASPVAQRLCDTFGETVHMGILDDYHAVYVMKKESSYTIRMYSRVGKSIPLYCTGIGKILLSGMNSKEVETYLQIVKLKPYTPKTIRTIDALRAEIQQVKRQGWACDDEEHEMGTFCIAAPIRDYSGHVVAAMSVSWPLFRFDMGEREKYTKTIMDECMNLSKQLGYEQN